MADRQTLGVYARRASDYAARFNSEAPDRYLSRFISNLRKASRVLDFGCGTGRAAAFMRDAGLEVDAWDASAKMAAIGKATFDLDIRIATFGELAAKEEYDGIYANFSLLHAPKSEMPDHLYRIAVALRPSGLLHIGLKTGKGEARDRLGRFYAYYEDDEITELLNNAGLTVETRDFGAEAGLEGTVEPWIIVQAKKTGSIQS